MTASEDSVPVRVDIPNRVSMVEVVRIGSFPSDYDFGTNKPNYLVGMSVPPVMTAQIASRVWEKWLSISKKDSAAIA